MKLSISSSSPYQTKSYGKIIGQKLKGGEVIELKSDLGGGKTTFTHGLAEGINSQDRVASPTFTISRQYKGSQLNLHHFDFYRLNDPGLVAHELEEALEDDTAVAVIEWAEIVQDVLPESRLILNFVVTNDQQRQILLDFPEELEYLVKDLK